MGRLLLGVVLLSACGCEDKGASKRPGSGSGPKYGFLVDGTPGYWEAVRQGVARAEKKLGIRVDFKVPASNAMEKQILLIDEFQDQGYTALALAPAGSRGMQTRLEEAATHMRLVCIENDVPLSNRAAYVGPDHYEIGYELGELVAKAFPSGGRMAVLAGNMDMPAIQDRYKGLKDALRKRGVKMTEMTGGPILDGFDLNKVQTTIVSLVTADEPAQVIIGLGPYHGPAIAASLQVGDRWGKVIAFCCDQQEETLKAIETGIIAAAVVIDPVALGEEAVKIMYNLVARVDYVLPEGGLHFIPHRLLNRANIHEAATRAAEASKPS